MDTLVKGDRAVVAEVMDHDAKLLQYLDQKGLYPGIEIEVMEIDPFDGPFLLRIGTIKQSIALNAAKNIYVVISKSKENV